MQVTSQVTRSVTGSLNGDALYDAAMVIVRKYSASAYIPARENYSESALTSVAVNDGSVGGVKDGKTVSSFPATQTTAGFKPLLVGGARNLLTYSEQFDNAIWVKTRASIIANATTAPDGTLTADTLREDTSTNSHLNLYTISLTAGVAYTLSVYAKAAGRNFAALAISSAYFSNADVILEHVSLVDGSFGVQDTNTTSRSATNVGNGWWRISCTFTPTISISSTLGYRPAESTSSSNYLGDGTSGIYIWGAQLEAGLTASPYVPTTSSAASSGSRPKSWLFDGTDDRLVIGDAPFQMSDDHFVVVCATVVTSTGVKSLFSLGSSSTSNPYINYRIGSLAVGFTVRDDTGVNTVSSTGGSGNDATLASPFVATYRKVESSISAKKNGGTPTTGTPIGAFTLNQSAIGALYRQAGVADLHNANIYGVIAGKGTISDAELLVLEKWLASLGGLSI